LDVIAGRRSPRRAVFSPRDGIVTPVSRFFAAQKRKHSHAVR
jgi:hypothetical protein